MGRARGPYVAALESVVPVTRDDFGEAIHTGHRTRRRLLAAIRVDGRVPQALGFLVGPCGLGNRNASARYGRQQPVSGGGGSYVLQGHDALVDLTTVVASTPGRVGDLFGQDGRLPSRQEGYARLRSHCRRRGLGFEREDGSGTWGANRRRPPGGLAETALYAHRRHVGRPGFPSDATLERSGYCRPVGHAMAPITRSESAFLLPCRRLATS